MTLACSSWPKGACGGAVMGWSMPAKGAFYVLGIGHALGESHPRSCWNLSGLLGILDYLLGFIPSKLGVTTFEHSDTNRLRILDTRNQIRTNKNHSRPDQIRIQSGNIRTIYIPKCMHARAFFILLFARIYNNGSSSVTWKKQLGSHPIAS